MTSSEVREIFLKEYEGDPGSNVEWLNELRSAPFYGTCGFSAIAHHITGLKEELEELKSNDKKTFKETSLGQALGSIRRQSIVIQEQEKRLREQFQEINNLKAEVKDLAESREAVRKQLKYADDAVAYLHKENRSMGIQGYDYVGAESIGAYGSGQTYVRIWRKK